MKREVLDNAFNDDISALTYRICEDDSPMAAPPLVEPCRACDEAKYEVMIMIMKIMIMVIMIGHLRGPLVPSHSPQGLPQQ